MSAAGMAASWAWINGSGGWDHAFVGQCANYRLTPSIQCVFYAILARCVNLQGTTMSEAKNAGKHIDINRHRLSEEHSSDPHLDSVPKHERQGDVSHRAYVC